MILKHPCLQILKNTLPSTAHLAHNLTTLEFFSLFSLARGAWQPAKNSKVISIHVKTICWKTDTHSKAYLTTSRENIRSIYNVICICLLRVVQVINSRDDCQQLCYHNKFNHHTNPWGYDPINHLKVWMVESSQWQITSFLFWPKQIASLTLVFLLFHLLSLFQHLGLKIQLLEYFKIL